MSETVSKARIITGKVVSDKMQKTVVVLVERTVKHPKYGKILKRRSKMHAHDETQRCKIGDMVRIQESRPLSKTKSWIVLDVL